MVRHLHLFGTPPIYVLRYPDAPSRHWEVGIGRSLSGHPKKSCLTTGGGSPKVSRSLRPPIFIRKDHLRVHYDYNNQGPGMKLLVTRSLLLGWSPSTLLKGSPSLQIPFDVSDSTLLPPHTLIYSQTHTHHHHLFSSTFLYKMSLSFRLVPGPISKLLDLLTSRIDRSWSSAPVVSGWLLKANGKLPIHPYPTLI